MKKIITLISLCLMMLVAKSQSCQTSYSGFTQTVCDIHPYTFNQHALAISGTYTDTLVNFHGCDSVIYLYLTVLPSNINQTKSICTGSTFTFKSQQLSVSGIYKDSLTNYLGCDSIITLNLTVSATYPVTQTLTTASPSACGSNPVSFTVHEQDTSITNIFYSCNGGGGNKLLLNTIQVNTFYATGITHNASYFNGATNMSVTNLIPGNNYSIYAAFDTSYLYPAGAGVMMWIDFNHNGIFDATEILVNSQGTNYINTGFTIPANTLSGATLMRIRTTANGAYLPNPCVNYTTGSTDDFKVYITTSNNLYDLKYVGASSSSTVSTFSSNTFSPSIPTSALYFTTVTNQQGCSINTDSIQLNVLAASADTIYDTICHGTFNFNGQLLNQTGTYQSHLNNAVGCDSAVTLKFISHISFTYLNQNLCHGGSFVFKNQTLTQPGTYYDTLTNYMGCDSLITLSLIVPTTYTWQYHYLCAGATDTFNNHILTTSGYYYDTLPDHANCGDSILILYLTIYNPVIANAGNDYNGCGGNGVTLGGFPTATGGYNGSNAYSYNWLPSIGLSNSNIAHPIAAPTNNTVYKLLVTDAFGCIGKDSMQFNITNSTTFGNINQNICNGSSYFFNNQTITASGIYYDTLINFSGCDSIITLHLLANTSSSSIINQSICGNSSFQFNNQSLTNAGVYFDTLVNYTGCDSIITLNLSITTAINLSVNHTTCFNVPYLFNGQMLSNSGTFLDTLLGTSCDTFVTLNLVVLPISNTSISQTICGNQFYFFNNQNLNTSGAYTQTLINYLGCDSIITLHLTVNPISNTTINQTICNYAPYVFNGKSLTASGTYYDTLINQFTCDSIITLNLTLNPLPAVHMTGTFAHCGDSCMNVTISGSALTSWTWRFAGGISTTSFNATLLNQTICLKNISPNGVIAFIGADINGCQNFDTVLTIQPTDCVWPGDANSDLVADNLDIFPIGLLNGTTGPIRNNASLIWIDQPATPFGTTASGFIIDAKHADCNGDGIIDGNDTTAILQNYGLTHLRKKSGADLMTLTVGPDTLYQNTTAIIHIGLGTAALPIDSVYGVAFSFNVDPTAIDTNSITITAPASWLFNNATDHFQIFKLSKSATRVDVGLVRNNHISKSGFGDVVTVTIDITTGNIVGREDALAAYNKKYQLHCSVDNVTILKLDGSMISANVVADSSIVLYNKPDGISNVSTQNLSQSIIPNPATNNVSIKLRGYNYNEEKKLILIDATGRLMLQKTFTSNQTTIDISELNQGIYIAKIISEKGISESKLIKQ
ncbi:MAG: hypothetical protein RJA07_2815 [Bacteroidota bacterium]|jgi:hypothetical protein